MSTTNILFILISLQSNASFIIVILSFILTNTAIWRLRHRTIQWSSWVSCHHFPSWKWTTRRLLHLENIPITTVLQLLLLWPPVRRLLQVMFSFHCFSKLSLFTMFISSTKREPIAPYHQATSYKDNHSCPNHNQQCSLPSSWSTLFPFCNCNRKDKIPCSSFSN